MTAKGPQLPESFAKPSPIERIRVWLASLDQRIPYWKEINDLSLIVANPIRRFADYSLRMFPALRRWEWLLETQSLVNRSPVALALPAVVCLWRGLRPTDLGHIGTDLSLYPLVAATSAFNPFLGLCCAFLFGIGDFIQKLLFNDIYGAESRFGFNYWGALIGYVLAYSAVMLMAIAPGVMARVFRKAVISFVVSTRNADGAADIPRPASVGEDLAAMSGSFLGSFATLYVGAPILEAPAFFRSSPI